MQLKKDINSNLITIKNLLNLNKEINQAISLIYRTIKGGNKVYICGNGGSAGEAQHLAAEMVESAIENQVSEGKALTYDLGGNASTSEVSDAICMRVASMLKTHYASV